MFIDLKGLPLIHSYDSIQELNHNIEKHDRGHDLVISSYALGEIPSLSDRITIVRQLWDLTRDVLILLEPGTPQGAKIISQMRSYILWMERSKGVPLRGFEDEKFCYVALRRGKRLEEVWPLDGMKFETLKERHAKRNPEDLIIDYSTQFPREEDEEAPVNVEDSLVPYESDAQELSLFHESEEEELEEQSVLILEEVGAELYTLPFDEESRYSWMYAVPPNGMHWKVHLI
ncbi:hypothetical protein GUJ93_ZPchr0009g247 [Zizania palustris]|uniref:Uncharacterized protein n=1 Tax=Zizania palustris TaxID=103762 RepID=A0A8J5S3F5_ZIZPA|nr:hypothetical protein GUJ93_ZPchr0009g247 [Zizania palustris]